MKIKIQPTPRTDGSTARLVRLTGYNESSSRVEIVLAAADQEHADKIADVLKDSWIISVQS